MAEPTPSSNPPAGDSSTDLPAAQADTSGVVDADDSGDAVVGTIVLEEIVSDARVGPVRTGSPFAKDPPVVLMRARAAIQMRREFEAGLWRMTAGGAVLSAAILVPFGLIALWFFQIGALMISGLGGFTSLLGLTSIHSKWSLGLLIVHLSLFIGTFWRVLQG